MSDGDLLFAAVCDSIDLDGNSSDTTAVAALEDWLNEHLPPDSGLTLRCPGLILDLWRVRGNLVGTLHHDYDFSRFPSGDLSFSEWLCTSVGFAFYLQTK